MFHLYENHLLDLHNRYIDRFLYESNMKGVKLRHSGNLINSLEQILPLVVEERKVI